jgi:hypothetical protein
VGGISNIERRILWLLTVLILAHLNLKILRKTTTKKKYFLIYTSFDTRAILHEFKVKYSSNYYNK